ncbi:hypothetical protein [Phocaeicola plebeius]|uniref:hypothetical protein n=1 Tax=Phocaeicola plebeius TaxID=310297 RepID=UPI003AEF3831
MENKMVRVPFAVEIAKKITNGEVNGNIVTRDGRNARVICWDKKSDSIYNIVALLDEKIMERILTYTINGSEADGKDSDNDLMLEIPEYMTFKDGDIATLGWKSDNGEFCEWITILKRVEVDEINILTEDYVTFCLKCDEENYFPIDFDCTSDGAKWIRKPTETEKQKLIDALKESKDPEAKECLKMLGIEVNPKCEFKPFDKVLVRDYDDGVWKPDIFLNNSDGCNYMCTGSVVWAQCIPYNDQTAHLLGTNKDWEE